MFTARQKYKLPLTMNLAVSSLEKPYMSCVRSLVPMDTKEMSPSVTIDSARTHARGTVRESVICNILIIGLKETDSD